MARTNGLTGRWRRQALIGATAVALAAAAWAPGAALADGPGDHDPAPLLPAQGLREIPLPGPLQVLPTGFIQPESAVYDEKAKAFYTGEQTGGAVAKVFLDGRPPEVLVPRGANGQLEAVGVTQDAERRLYVAGGALGVLRVYDPDTKALLGSFPTLGSGVGPGFLNDVTVDRSGDVYATDSIRPQIYRWTAAQIGAGQGSPEVIATSPEATSLPVGTGTVKPFNNNGIRPTPDGRYILFNDLNDGALYRLTPPKYGSTQREIVRVRVAGGVLGDADGMEFVGDTLYLADNGGERILKLKPSKDFASVTVESATTSPAFHTPTAVAKGPGDTLLVPNSELFDPNGPPFFVDTIKRP